MDSTKENSETVFESGFGRVPCLHAPNNHAKVRASTHPTNNAQAGWKPTPRFNRISRSRPCVYLLLVLLSTLCPASTYATQTDSFDKELRLIDGLRQRQLFSLAEQHCKTLLQTEGLAITERTGLTIERIKNQVAEGIVTSGDRRSAVSNQVDKIAAEFESVNPNHSRHLLVKMQQAAAHQTLGSLVVQEIAAEILPSSNKSVALDQLRLATGYLKKLESTIDKLIPEQRARSLTPDELNPTQLINLKKNVRYQQAKTNLIKAGLYGDDEKLNKADALSQVMQRLKDVLRQTDREQILWWQAQLDQAKCQRLLGNLQAADKTLTSVVSKEMPDDMQAQFLEERIRISTAAKKWGTTVDLLAATESIQQPTPELRLAMLQMLLTVAERKSANQAKYRDQASELTKLVENAHGPYWGRRAELLLIGETRVGEIGGTGPTTGASSNLDTLIRIGNTAIRKRNFADAVKAFDKAAQVAAAENNTGQQLVMSVKSGQALEQQKLFAAASDKLVATSRQFNNQELAPASHLRGCWNWSQTKQTSEKNKKLQTLLQEHIETWPDSPTSDQAKLWLGGLHQNERRFAQALDAYLAIDLASPHMLSAAKQIGPSGVSVFTANNNAGAVRNLIERIRKKLGLLESAQKPKWSAAEKELATGLAEIGLVSGEIDAAVILEILTSANHAKGDDVTPKWKQRAAAWKAVALAHNPKTIEQAQNEIQELPNRAELMTICWRGLSAIYNTDSKLAALKNMVCDKSLLDSNAAQTTTVWQIRKSQTLNQLGEFEKSRVLLLELARQKPKSLLIKTELARAAAQVSGNESEAISLWRKLAAKTKPGTPTWFESKYEVARLLAATGKQQDALKLLNYLQAVGPNWKESKFKNKFEQLLNDLKQ